MDPISSNVAEGINFLAELYDDGLSYSLQGLHCQLLCNFKMEKISEVMH